MEGAKSVDRPRVGRDGSSWVNRVVLLLLGSLLRPLLDEKLCALRYTVASTGATVVFPVEYAFAGDRLLVLAGRPERKRWWRHFMSAAPVEVWWNGRWVRGEGRVAAGAERQAAIEEYRRRFTKARVVGDPPLVVIHIGVRQWESLHGNALAWVWFILVTTCELAGFAVPAAVAAATVDAAPAVLVSALTAAGAVEGAALGWGQATVLRRALPGLSRARWVWATASAASLAYLLGLGPSTWAAGMLTWPPVLQAAVAVVLGAVLLGSIGFAQWLVLRAYHPHAARWIPITAAAWLLGLTVFLVFTMQLWHPGQSPGLVAGIGVAGGLLMAATTSAVTGYALRRMLP